jgi:hypothetical protein
MVLYAIFGSLAQFGIRPHRIVSKVRCVVFVRQDRMNSAFPGLHRKYEGIDERVISVTKSAGDFPIARRHLNQCDGFSRVRKVIHTQARDVPKST